MFNIEQELAKVNAEYFANCAEPAIDRDSVLYKSLMLKNQTELLTATILHERNERYFAKLADRLDRIIYTNHGNGPEWSMP